MVRNRRLDQNSLLSQLKCLVADMFRLDIVEPDKIADNEPLNGDGLGLDSLDAFELALCIEEAFGIAITGKEESTGAFASIASLADFIQASKRGLVLRLHRSAEAVPERPLQVDGLGAISQVYSSQSAA